MINSTPISIPMEDDLVHTTDQPLCDDPTCPCQDDETLRQEALYSLLPDDIAIIDGKHI